MLADPPADIGELLACGYAVASPTGCLLTDAGHECHEALLAAERATLDIAAVRADFAVFEGVDPAVKARCVALQVLREEDQDGWQGQVDQLRRLLEDTVAAIDRTARDVPRFSDYAARLRRSLDRVERGELDYLTGVRVDSFHTVWMECHEDYLLTLGENRSDVGPQ